MPCDNDKRTERVAFDELNLFIHCAQDKGLCDALLQVYVAIPETTCPACARCCFQSPGVFFVEYLYLISKLAKIPARRQESLLKRGLGELFFSWIDPGWKCLFLDSSRCEIYLDRPLACRLFGNMHYADPEQREMEAHMSAREEAKRLRLFGIEAPETVILNATVACNRVTDHAGKPIRLDSDVLVEQVRKIDKELLPEDLVAREFYFLSLPERLGVMVYEDALENLRLQMLRRVQGGENAKKLTHLLWKQIALPAPLLGRYKAKRPR